MGSCISNCWTAWILSYHWGLNMEYHCNMQSIGSFFILLNRVVFGLLLSFIALIRVNNLVFFITNNHYTQSHCYTITYLHWVVVNCYCWPSSIVVEPSPAFINCSQTIAIHHIQSSNHCHLLNSAATLNHHLIMAAPWWSHPAIEQPPTVANHGWTTTGLWSLLPSFQIQWRTSWRVVMKFFYCRLSRYRRRHGLGMQWPLTMKQWSRFVA